MEKKNNTLIIVLLVIFIIATICLASYIAYDKIVVNKDVVIEEEVDEELSNETIDKIVDYTGKYFNIDGDPTNDSYIELKSDNTYSSKRNLCSEYVEGHGTYSIKEEDGKFIITLDTYTFGDETDSNYNVSFDFENGSLKLISTNEEDNYYDCTNATTFKK